MPIPLYDTGTQILADAEKLRPQFFDPYELALKFRKSVTDICDTADVIIKYSETVRALPGRELSSSALYPERPAT